MLTRSWFGALATVAALATTVGPAWGQSPADVAAVIVEGVVRDFYKGAVAGQVNALVQLEASRTEMGRRAAEARRLPIPAPGDPVYVHLKTTGKMPRLGATIRAFLAPRPGGGWQGVGDDWFEEVGGPPVNVPTPRPEPESETAPATQGPSGKTILKDLGVKADPVEVNGRLVLKVDEALAGGPMQKAGFEKGDVVIGVNKSGFASLQQFAELIAKGPATAEFAVLNVRNNEQATVPVDVSGLVGAAPERTPTPTTPAPAAPKRSLGVTVEPVRLGLRTALKVTAVEPNGAAKKAGIEVGDVLVEAGGVALNDPAKLQAAVDAAGDNLAVSVRDIRTGRDVPVEVALGSPGPTPTPAPTTPAPTPAPDGPAGGGTSSRSFGLTVKPGTADLLPVVKVAAVAPGSPAEKAGLEVGDAIVGVDDRVVFAPDLFEEALKSVGSSFTLTVLDVKTGKKTPVKVDLGR